MPFQFDEIKASVDSMEIMISKTSEEIYLAKKNCTGMDALDGKVADFVAVRDNPRRGECRQVLGSRYLIHTDCRSETDVVELLDRRELRHGMLHLGVFRRQIIREGTNEKIVSLVGESFIVRVDHSLLASETVTDSLLNIIEFEAKKYSVRAHDPAFELRHRSLIVDDELVALPGGEN